MRNCDGSGKTPIVVDWEGYRRLRCRLCAATWQIMESAAEGKPLPNHTARTEPHEKALLALANHVDFCATCRPVVDLNRLNPQKMPTGLARQRLCEVGKNLTRVAMQFAGAMV